MQLVSCRIWTRITVSIFYDDNHYTTGTSTLYFNIYDTKDAPKSKVQTSAYTVLILLYK